MRRGITMTLAVALIAMVMASAAFAGVSGRFSTTLKGLKGTWVLAIAGNGSYTLTFGGKFEARGEAAFSGSTVTVGHESGPLACKGAAATGTYTYSLSGSTLRLHVRHDACTNRSYLLGHTFTKS